MFYGLYRRTIQIGIYGEKQGEKHDSLRL